MRDIRPRQANAPAPHRLCRQKLFLDEPGWRAAVAKRELVFLDATPPKPDQLVPKFTQANSPAQALRGFLKDQMAVGRRILLTAAAERDLKTLERRVRQSAGDALIRVPSLDAALAT